MSSAGDMFIKLLEEYENMVVNLIWILEKVFLILFGSVLGAILGPYVQNYLSEKENKKEEIYKPLHSELHRIKSGDPRDFPYERNGNGGRFVSKWENFPAHKRDRVGQRLFEQLDHYVTTLDKLNIILKNIENQLRKRENSSRCLEQIEAGVMLKYESRNGDGTHSPCWTPVETFVGKNGPVLLLAESPTELRKMVIEYTESNRLHPYLPWREIDMEYFELIYEASQDGVNEFKEKNRDEDVESVFDQITASADTAYQRISSKI